jgi:hypothetical protein
MQKMLTMIRFHREPHHGLFAAVGRDLGRRGAPPSLSNGSALTGGQMGARTRPGDSTPTAARPGRP